MWIFGVFTPADSIILHKKTDGNLEVEKEDQKDSRKRGKICMNDESGFLINGVYKGLDGAYNMN